MYAGFFDEGGSWWKESIMIESVSLCVGTKDILAGSERCPEVVQKQRLEVFDKILVPGEGSQRYDKMANLNS